MDNLKKALSGAAKEVGALIPERATLGLGSGSTVAALLDVLSPMLKRKKVAGGVPTSTQIDLVAARNGIRALPFGCQVDVVLDGADQVDENLNLIKGGGGALLKEKVLIGSARRTLIFASEGKFSERLCERGVRVPVEVFPFARANVKSRLSRLGGKPEERLLPKGYPYFTENGNVILDTAFSPLKNPEETEVLVKSLPGVAEVGIFTIKPITVFKLNEDGTHTALKAPVRK
jgi:ribose 5-phosphate isomerase A